MEGQKPERNNYNPVTVTIAPEDTVGAALLGVLSIILLIALLVSQRRNRQLQKELAETRLPVLIEE
ncbi:hypothetical protein GC175_12420 [bacterium]|nr:hypothetical protein [bacterium]